MSAITTIDITEDTARRLIMSKILTYSFEDLEEHCDAILRDRLYNCNIVPNGSENDDDLL